MHGYCLFKRLILDARQDQVMTTSLLAIHPVANRRLMFWGVWLHTFSGTGQGEMGRRRSTAKQGVLINLVKLL